METAIDPQSAGLYLGEDIHGNKSGVRLDADHINRCMSVATYNPEIRTCIQYITNRVLSRGIEIRKESMKGASREFSDHVQVHYAAFITDVLRVGLITGVVPYVFVKMGPFKAPVVLTHLIDKIRMVMTTKGPVFKMDDDKKTGQVFFEVMYTPTREGMCTSPVASMVRTHDFVMGQELNMFICNELNARPPLFLTTASASFNETNLVDGSGINAESEFKSQLIRNKIQLNIIKTQQMQAQYGAMAEGVEKNPIGLQRDRITGLPVVNYEAYSSFNPDYCVLPNDSRIHSHSVSHPPHGLEAAREYFRNAAATVFGISPSIFHNMSGNTSSGAAAVAQDTSDSAIANIKMILSRLCIKCYRVIFNDQDDDVVFLFPSTYDRSNIEKLYAQGIITHEYYIKYLSEDFDIPMSAFEATPIPRNVNFSGGGDGGAPAVKTEAGDPPKEKGKPELKSQA